MPSIDERLEAVTHSVELFLLSQEQLSGNLTRLEGAIHRLEGVVNVLGEGQAASEKRLDKIERILQRLASMTIDHEQRLQDIENA